MKALLVAALALLPQGHIDVTVHDGDTLKYGHTRIRLHGIDAPELSQTCKDKNRRMVLCGRDSRDAMRALVKGGVNCTVVGDGGYGRPLAICINSAGVNISQELVREGWALAYRKYSVDYVKDETIAKELGAGMWAGDFIDPSSWRHGVRW